MLPHGTQRTDRTNRNLNLNEIALDVHVHVERVTDVDESDQDIHHDEAGSFKRGEDDLDP